MLFEFLRQQGVDISRYLPQFLFKDKEKNLQDLLAVCSWEHEKQRIMLQEIAKQFFVENATWGLSDWERIVEVRPNPGDNYQQRRNRILLKLNGTQTSTLEFMERLIKRYVSEDSVIRLEEQPEDYVFNIHFDGGRILYPDDLFEAIHIYIPAHLGLSFWFERKLSMSDEDSLHVGLATSASSRQSIGLAKMPADEMPLFAGLYLTTGRHAKQVGAGARLPPDDIGLTAGAYDCRSQYKKILFNPDDISDRVKGLLLPSVALPEIGNAAVRSSGHRRLWPSIGRNSAHQVFTGLAVFKARRGCIGSASPKAVMLNEPRAGLVLGMGGRHIIGTADDYLRPRVYIGAHAGLAHAGLMPVGIAAH